MGPPLRQPRRHTRCCGLGIPNQPRRRSSGQRDSPDDQRRPRSHDQSARDPGLPCTRKLLQQSRARPRRPRQSRYRGRGLEDARPIRETDRRRHLASLGRRAKPAHLPPRPKRHVPQILGRRRRLPTRREPRAQSPARRARRADRALGAHMGLLRRAVQRPEIRVPAALRQLCDGERPLQGLLPRRIPLPNRHRSRQEGLRRPRGTREIRRGHQGGDMPHARSLHPHHRQAA